MSCVLKTLHIRRKSQCLNPPDVAIPILMIFPLNHAFANNLCLPIVGTSTISYLAQHPLS